MRLHIDRLFFQVLLCVLSAVDTTFGLHQLPQNDRRLFLSGIGGASILSVSRPAFSAVTSYVQFPGLTDAQNAAYGKPRITYPDFVPTTSGLQYKDAKVGTGESARVGDRVVLNWEGYTIGFYGRPFEKKNSVKGGAFDKDQEFYRFVIGKHETIPALEEGLTGMKIGGIRQIVVPPELGYPISDRSHNTIGPKPSTFSGQRALDFVLFNEGMLDKTLLFNVELRRIDRLGERGFTG
jgi:hypothetical protein